MASITRITLNSGEIRYKVQIRKKNIPSQTKTFKRKTDAEKWVRKVETQIDEGLFQAPLSYSENNNGRNHGPSITNLTFREMVHQYIDMVLPGKSPNYAINQKNQLEWWVEQLGGYTITETRPAMIARCRNKLVNTGGASGRKLTPASANRYLAALSHVYTIAIREWEWIVDNPLKKVDRLKEPRGRVRWLDDDEREELLESCRQSSCPFLLPIVMIAIATGARKTEILSLTWKQIDFERGRAIIHETKNGDRRMLPLGPQIISLLYNYRKTAAPRSKFLFPNAYNTGPFEIKKPWKKALKRAQTKDFRFHDLRHTAASYLAMSGATLFEIAEILGHKSLQMVKRYAHLCDNHVSKVVERMNNKIFQEKAVEPVLCALRHSELQIASIVSLSAFGATQQEIAELHKLSMENVSCALTEGYLGPNRVPENINHAFTPRAAA